MALTVIDVEALQSYLVGVMDRADHHGEDVNEIALALVGAILWRKDEAESIRVMTQGGETKNVLWVPIGGQRYAFSYNHDLRSIEMRRGGTQGVTVASFRNDTPLSDVRRVFGQL